MFYELDAREELPDRVRSLLGHREAWEAVQDRAWRTAGERHTWADRAERLHKEILCNIG